VDAPSPTPATPVHLRWGVEALRVQLQPLLPGIEIEVIPRLDSTNTRLLERARLAGGDRDALITGPGDLDAASRGTPSTPLERRTADLVPGLLVAEEQTAGRGRLGRGWNSAPGRSLTFSLGLPMAPAQWGGLSLAVGVALAQALEPEPATPRLLLKWPNDLWLLDAATPAGGRKLGGVLIETVAVGRHRRVVVGVGLNVLPLPPDADAAPALAHGYASLHEIDAAASAPKVLATVALPLARALRRFEHEGFGPFAAGYAARDLLQGRAVAVQGAVPLEGTAEGVDAQGALRVRTADRMHLVVGGEASVRAVPPSPGLAA
jgi:BirA family biotin operon repressor/biotin-[acetyl-CoA-carboxylase] ligase